MESNMYVESFEIKDSVGNEKDISARLGAFFHELDWFFDSELNAMIEKSTPKLMKQLATMLGEHIVDETKQHILSWRNGDIKTLDEVYGKISYASSEINRSGFLLHRSPCQQVIAQWAKGTVEKDIATEIKRLCDKHAVVDLCGHCTLPPILLASSNTMMNPSAMGETLSAIIPLVTVVSGIKLYETISSVILQKW